VSCVGGGDECHLALVAVLVLALALAVAVVLEFLAWGPPATAAVRSVGAQHLALVAVLVMLLVAVALLLAFA
jgi:hypothetical protein